MYALIYVCISLYTMWIVLRSHLFSSFPVFWSILFFDFSSVPCLFVLFYSLVCSNYFPWTYILANAIQRFLSTCLFFFHTALSFMAAVRHVDLFALHDGTLSKVYGEPCPRLHAATCCNTLHHTAPPAPHCTTLRHTAPHCNTWQHTATHCNTLQHTL